MNVISVISLSSIFIFGETVDRIPRQFAPLTPTIATITGSHGRPQKFFQGGQSRHFAYPFQVADDATQMNVHEALNPFYTSKKCPMLRQQLHAVLSL